MNRIIFTLIAGAIASFSCLTFAQTSHPSNTHWGISAGWDRYTEGQAMSLTGPEAGLHGRLTLTNQSQLEGDILVGAQHYESQQTGSKNNVANIETRWRILTPVLADYLDGVSIGLGYHTLWNDLRGQTTTGNGGYQRIANQLWIPARWNINSTLQLDGGLLLYGRHTSKLSEANRSYSDVTNTQKHGHYLQLSSKLMLDRGQALTPFIRFTHLADSNTVAMGGRLWVEPTSNRWQIGAVWEFDGR